jgi:putative ABC transport system permease protein
MEVAQGELDALSTEVTHTLADGVAGWKQLPGLMSYDVARRRREIGIRMALGARPSAVLRTVLRDGITVTLAGIAAGLAGALISSRLVASLLFGVTAHDPATFIGAPAVLVAVALAACLLPARRASRIDPIVALRSG